MTTPTFNCWGFIIDTDGYAGNFEREMCAYLTGEIGECGVGDKSIDDEEDYSIFADALVRVQDDHHCQRPVSIYPTPGFYNNGMGFEYKEGQEKEAIDALIKSTKDYYTPLINTAERHKEKALKGEQVFSWDVEACDKAIKSYQKNISDAMKTTEKTLGKYPSYQSVCIFFGKKPTTEQIDFMKRKAQVFFSKAMRRFNREKNQAKILGFRLTQFKSRTSEKTYAI